MTEDSAKTYQEFENTMFSLLKDMDGRLIKNSLRNATRKVAKQTREIPLARLRNYPVKGDRTDWEKALRVHEFNLPHAIGFTVSVQPRPANGKGAGTAKGFHANRYYGHMTKRGVSYTRKFPAMKWVEEGVSSNRRTRGSWRRKGHSTGGYRINGVHALESTEQMMTSNVENNYSVLLDDAVLKIAKKNKLV